MNSSAPLAPSADTVLMPDSHSSNNASLQDCDRFSALLCYARAGAMEPSEVDARLHGGYEIYVLVEDVDRDYGSHGMEQVVEVKMMKRGWLSLVVSVLVMTLALTMVGCGTTPSEASTSAAEAPAEVQHARDAAVTFVREHFDEAPADSLSWEEEKLTPEGLVGGEEWQYTAGDWVVKVSYGVVAPEWTVYHVTVSNASTGFGWEGRVDGSGRAPEAPETALVARDQALLYASEQHGQSGLGAGLAWQEERLTPGNIVGAETYQYTAGDWVVTVSYPVVLPENTIYTITIANEASSFQWEGEVDAQGALTEH